MRTLGNKVAARKTAEAAGVPVMPASGPLPADIEQCKQIANSIGYPFMLKASWGGGGRGMRVLENEADLIALVDVARREAQAAFGNDEVYLEKLVRNARHVEVQIIGDLAGNVVHLFERDCSMQRRNQKWWSERQRLIWMQPPASTCVIARCGLPARWDIPALVRWNFYWMPIPTRLILSR